MCIEPGTGQSCKLYICIFILSSVLLEFIQESGALKASRKGKSENKIGSKELSIEKR